MTNLDRLARTLVLLLLVGTVLGAALRAAPGTEPRARGIVWEDAYDLALEKAAADKKVVFIAVNMDGEAANERMVKKVYKDKALIALTEHTVNLVASANRHSKSGKCPRFGCRSCDVHREVEIDVRENLLEPDGSGAVIAPQHIFLGPGGGVLLSVPYEVSALELEWCFGEAFKLAGITDGPKISPKARRPRRLVNGGVANVGARNMAPLTRGEALELIKELRRGGNRGEQNSMLRHLATADEPEARDYVLSVLRANSGGRAGGGGRRGGGGRTGDAERERAALLRWIGTASPKSYVEVVLPFVGSGLESTRNEAIVALEQLNSDEALKELLGTLKKEKDDLLRKNLLRAIGSCGVDDRKSRAALMKASNDLRNPLARQNALLGLGWVEGDEDVDERLRQAALPEEFGKKAKVGPDRITDLEREAAVVAMGLSRNGDWKELLTALKDDEDESQELRDAAAASLEVLGGADLHALRGALMRAGTDEIPRERLFPEVRERQRR